MRYVHRFEHPGAMFHVTAHSVDGEIEFRTVEDHRNFNWILGSTVDRLGLRVLMWCHVVNHHHLLVQTPQANLAASMHRLMSTYARGFNIRHGRRGHLFRERYRSTLVQGEEHFARCVRYIALNPVKHGLVDRPERYRWCNFGSIVRGGRPSPANAQVDVVTHFGGVEALVAHVEEGLRELQAASRLAAAA
jgi:REP element-mobilizing transposase RayT